MCEVPGSLLSSISTHADGDHVYYPCSGAFLVVLGFEAAVLLWKNPPNVTHQQYAFPIPRLHPRVTTPADDNLPPSVIIVLVVVRDEATWVRVLQRFSGIRPSLRALVIRERVPWTSICNNASR